MGALLPFYSNSPHWTSAHTILNYAQPARSEDKKKPFILYFYKNVSQDILSSSNIKSKASPFLVLMKVYGSKIWKPNLESS